jgi:hypothetical protein
MTMSIAERSRDRVLALVQPELESGETVQACLPSAQTGPTPWFALLTYLIYFWIRMVGIVVTDRRVILVKRGTLTNRVKGVEAAFPRSGVAVTDWHAANLWSRLVLSTPTGPLKVNVHRIYKVGAQSVVAALAQPPIAPPPPPAPPA